MIKNQATVFNMESEKVLELTEIGQHLAKLDRSLVIKKRGNEQGSVELFPSGSSLLIFGLPLRFRSESESEINIKAICRGRRHYI